MEASATAQQRRPSNRSIKMIFTKEKSTLFAHLLFPSFSFQSMSENYYHHSEYPTSEYTYSEYSSSNNGYQQTTTEVSCCSTALPSLFFFLFSFAANLKYMLLISCCVVGSTIHLRTTLLRLPTTREASRLLARASTV